MIHLINKPFIYVFLVSMNVTDSVKTLIIINSDVY
jgi:hypothetical protein